jgi:hypothetical protein
MNPTDKAILHYRSTPLAAADIPPAWLHQVREVVIRDGHKLRAGFPACIEVKGPADWQPLQLPNNGVEFVGRRDRDTVLAWLNGDRDLPQIPIA